MSRLVCVFEASPADPPAWMQAAAKDHALTWISDDEVADVMAKDPEVQKRLLSKGVTSEDPELAKDYLAALDKVAKGRERLAVYSTSWLFYGLTATAVVLDLSPIEAEGRRGREAGVSEEEVRKYVDEQSAKLRRRAREGVSDAAAVLEVPKEADEATKGRLAREHVGKFLRAAR